MLIQFSGTVGSRPDSTDRLTDEFASLELYNSAFPAFGPPRHAALLPPDDKLVPIANAYLTLAVSGAMKVHRQTERDQFGAAKL